MTTSRALPVIGAVVVAVASLALLGQAPMPGAGGVGALVALGALPCAAVLARGASTPRPDAACLRLALGGTWLVPMLVVVTALPVWARTMFDASGPAVGALAAWAVLAPARRPRVDGVNTALRAVTAAAAAAFASRLLLVDPFTDPDCESLCEHNPWHLGVGTEVGDLATGLTHLALLAAIAWAGLAAARADRHLPTDGPHAARAALGVLGALAVVAAHGHRPVALGLPGAGNLIALIVAGAAVTGWALWGLADPVRQWWLGFRLSQMASRLEADSPPGAIEQSLRTATHDPGLTLRYATPTGRYVDEDGSPAPAVPVGRHRLTLVQRGGTPVAAVHHAPGFDGRRLERAMSPALRLALQNAQLRAVSLAELTELTASRARVVERAELERRRLERNLHDGAQQRAVSLALLIRMLLDQPDLDPTLPAAGRAQALARVTLEELRRIARGIHPAVLADGGLCGAALDLAERSTDVVVHVADLPPRRYTPVVESTAYLVMEAARADAAERGATEVCIAGAEHEALLIDVTDDVAQQSPSTRVSELVDRVEALGGRLEVQRGSAGTHVRLELPCER